MITSTHLKFKQDRMRVPSIEKRFGDRDRMCSYVVAVACDLAEEMYEKYGIELIVTEAWRTPEENRLVGGKGTSLHQSWKLAKPGEFVKGSATDFRSWELNEEQIKYGQDYVHNKWYVPVQAKLIWEPNARAGGHVHLQTVRFERWT